MMKDSIKKTLRYQLFFFLLFVAIIIAIVISINLGTVNIPLKKVFEIIFYNMYEGSVESDVIWKIRLPRILAGVLLGGALSVSGFLLQTFFRNPIAGPFVLGISSGAKLFVSFVMIVLLESTGGVSSTVLVFSAFVGAMISMGFVMIAAVKVKNIAMLLLVGVMIGYICSAITDFFITFARESDIANLTAWSMGSFSGVDWNDVKAMTVVVFVSFIAVFMLSKPIGAYQLGEGYAKSMGIDVKLFRFLLIIFSSLLSATVTAFAGPISFVGIAVPHLTKSIMNTARPIIILPATFLCGSVFCTYCDLIARTTFAPVEISISTVTSILGAPVVIWIMVSNKKQKI